MDAPFAANAQTNGTWKWHSRKWSWSTSSVGMFMNSMDFVLPGWTELRVTKPKHSTKTVSYWLILPHLHRVIKYIPWSPWSQIRCMWSLSFNYSNLLWFIFSLIILKQICSSKIAKEPKRDKLRGHADFKILYTPLLIHFTDY